MTELLSKDHTILERPFMEFRPFGMDEQGAKIRDVSGVVVGANVNYLEDCVARIAGLESAARTVQKLCRLLNERLRDTVYHVTTDFLRNEWHSYSYEFVCYLREFCEQLSEDSLFQFNVGYHKHISPLIQTLGLGRPFSLPQIYRMYPYFIQKYTKGAIDAEVVTVSAQSAVLRIKFTERSLRQFGPYRKRCAHTVCQSSKGGISSIPERVHGLPPAAVKDRTCIAEGDEWCEWEVTWTLQPSRRMFKPLRELFSEGAKLFGKATRGTS
jgi:hypothetical protein